MNRTVLLRRLVLLAAVVALAAFAVPAASDSFTCFCSGTLQTTPDFTETGATCDEARAGVQLDASASTGCDTCCFHPEITCTQLGDGTWQASGYAYYICSRGSF